MDKLRILTYNVNGLRDNSKRREVFTYLRTKKIDLIFMQEVHSDSSCEKWWSTQWSRKIFFSHGETNARGVAILISKKCNIEIHNLITDVAGRYIILYATYNSAKFLLANVYAPNKDNPEFFKKFFEDVNRFTPEYTILAGDMNLAIDSRLDRMGSFTNNNNAANCLKNKLEQNNLVDLWRTLHPDQNGYT